MLGSIGVLAIQEYSENLQWDEDFKKDACGSPRRPLPATKGTSLTLIIVADEAFGLWKCNASLRWTWIEPYAKNIQLSVESCPQDSGVYFWSFVFNVGNSHVRHAPGCGECHQGSISLLRIPQFCDWKRKHITDTAPLSTQKGVQFMGMRPPPHSCITHKKCLCKFLCVSGKTTCLAEWVHLVCANSKHTFLYLGVVAASMPIWKFQGKKM